MNTETVGKIFLHELNAEVPATRKCLKSIPENLFGWKPHEKSMDMGYLALLVAAMPEWIVHTISDKVIDFATYNPFRPKTTNELVKYFDENITAARNILEKVSDEEMKEMFFLKSSGQTLFSLPVDETVSSTLNHWVHHRGQLTVYMRLNNILVPSIYGPSADEKGF